MLRALCQEIPPKMKAPDSSISTQLMMLAPQFRQQNDKKKQQLGKNVAFRASFSGFLPLFASEKGYTWRIIPFGKWVVSMAIVSPRRIGLWDPFQMAELYVLFMRVILTAYIHRDDPPGLQASTLRCCSCRCSAAPKKNT